MTIFWVWCLYTVFEINYGLALFSVSWLIFLLQKFFLVVFTAMIWWVVVIFSLSLWLLWRPCWVIVFSVFFGQTLYFDRASLHPGELIGTAELSWKPDKMLQGVGGGGWGVDDLL